MTVFWLYFVQLVDYNSKIDFETSWIYPMIVKGYSSVTQNDQKRMSPQPPQLKSIASIELLKSSVKYIDDVQCEFVGPDQFLLRKDKIFNQDLFDKSSGGGSQIGTGDDRTPDVLQECNSYNFPQPSASLKVWFSGNASRSIQTKNEKNTNCNASPVFSELFGSPNSGLFSPEKGTVNIHTN